MVSIRKIDFYANYYVCWNNFSQNLKSKAKLWKWKKVQFFFTGLLFTANLDRLSFIYLLINVFTVRFFSALILSSSFSYCRSSSYLTVVACATERYGCWTEKSVLSRATPLVNCGLYPVYAGVNLSCGIRNRSFSTRSAIWSLISCGTSPL